MSAIEISIAAVAVVQLWSIARSARRAVDVYNELAIVRTAEVLMRLVRDYAHPEHTDRLSATLERIERTWLKKGRRA